MKKILLMVIVLLCWVQTTSAQTVIVGDMNFDDVLDVADVSSLVSTILGDKAQFIIKIDTTTVEMTTAKSNTHIVGDMNFDGVLDVVDVSSLVSTILGDKDQIIINGVAPKTYTVNGVSFKMIPVEGGTFQMGATAEQDSDAYLSEYPVHSVTLGDYYIGETEVTQALWYAVMGAKPSSSYSWSSTYGLGDDYPAYYISYTECQEFITKLKELTGKTFRMPTEAEWEYAARGGANSQGYKYAGSNTIDDVAWYDGNSGYSTHTVANKLPNELGLYDMSGNVCEWCSDWYGGYSSDAQTNPTGPETGPMRMRRGGSWFLDASICRVSSRSASSPSYQDPSYGLRLAHRFNGLVTSIQLSDTVLTLAPSSTKRLTATVFPADADNLTLTWTSSNESVAQVTSDGVVLAIARGTATITATANDSSGICAKCGVSVLADPTSVKTYSVNGVPFNMVPVAGGTFQMGATEEQGSDAFKNESPVHSVTLSDYYIGETEVTQALWYAVMGATPSLATPYTWISGYGLGDDYPAYWINWDMCQEFITKLNALTGETFRMLTEAEWEYAARGGSKSKGYKYAGSNTIDDVAWYCSNTEGSTLPVATKAPNELGLYDMSGNVRVWCSDLYDSYSSEPQTNPTGGSSETCTERVVRGGGFNQTARVQRVSCRFYFNPSYQTDDIGLRLAK